MNFSFRDDSDKENKCPNGVYEFKDQIKQDSSFRSPLKSLNTNENSSYENVTGSTLSDGNALQALDDEVKRFDMFDDEEEELDNPALHSYVEDIERLDDPDYEYQNDQESSGNFLKT